MSFNYDNASSEMFNRELNKIPEPYRTKFLQIVQETQTKLDNKLFAGSAGAGLLTITVDNKGTIKKLDIDKTLFEQNRNYEEFNGLISDLSAIAHSDAIKNVKKAIDEELAKLYSEILNLTKDIIGNKS
tara:strand:+ start:215 stop:601 length:387 start_codon:yes stop_codon:yes gene_type:complete